MKTVRLLWIVAFQWQHMLETSRRFSDLSISFYPRAYTICSMSVERPAVRSETKRFVLSVEYRNYPSCRDLSNLSKTCRKFQLHVLRWISRVFFLDEKHIPSGFGNEANRGAAKLDSEAGRGAGADRNTGVKGEVSAELSDFRCVFFSG